MKKQENTRQNASCFRPLAGIMVLIWLIEDERYENYEFPSPCGDYGSYQLRLSSATTIAPGKSFRPLAGIMVLINYDRRRSMLENMSFPSPCGDYGSYLRHFSRTAGRKTGQVSVPLRGLWFLSNRLPGKRRRPLARFRPLAGIMVLISQDVDNDKNKYTPFPSPCGDYGSYRNAFLLRTGSS